MNKKKLRIWALLHSAIVCYVLFQENFIFVNNHLVKPSPQVYILTEDFFSRFFYYLKRFYGVVHPPFFLHPRQNVLKEPEFLTFLNQSVKLWKPERRLMNFQTYVPQTGFVQWIVGFQLFIIKKVFLLRFYVLDSCVIDTSYFICI